LIWLKLKQNVLLKVQKLRKVRKNGFQTIAPFQAGINPTNAQPVA